MKKLLLSTLLALTIAIASTILSSKPVQAGPGCTTYGYCATLDIRGGMLAYTLLWKDGWDWEKSPGESLRPNIDGYAQGVVGGRMDLDGYRTNATGCRTYRGIKSERGTLIGWTLLPANTWYKVTDGSYTYLKVAC
ncbi:hypothetical protein ACQCX5_06305 [Propionibacteriaceae bacterium G57]|uniref:hypothetical protein n=1 Tax=Aestuariimicrobium sp. G57 TaxID=3418485 RepID=UPI003DA739D0